MKKSLGFWKIMGFIFVGIFGTLLHFAFDFANQTILLAPFSAVNESIWEHIKLLYFPAVVFAIIESRYLKDSYDTFWGVKLIGVALGVILIPGIHYTLKAILGSVDAWINIVMFYVSTGIMYSVEMWLSKRNAKILKHSLASKLILILMAAIFIVLTFITPHLPIFEDPLTNTYGYLELYK